MTAFKLGLIGDNIRASRAPALHRFAGELEGLDVSYDLFIPPAMEMEFEDVLKHVQDIGCNGVNITLPYKERVVPYLQIEDPLIKRIGACNTVVFRDGGLFGYNTDYSGFAAAYREAFGDTPPGKSALIGTGGVGRAVAFALINLGAEEIILIDTDSAKADKLAAELKAAGANARSGSIDELPNMDGVLNCTPLGMVGYGGTPVPEGLFPKNGWAFDAVYTPEDTEFRAQALAAGARFLSGYELYFHQGVDAFVHFTGQKIADPAALRALLRSGK